MRSKVKVVLVIDLVPALIALAVVEYQHFEQQALRQKLIDTALAHPEAIMYKQQFPHLFQREPNITDMEDSYWVKWSEGMTPGLHLFVVIHKGTEQVIEVMFSPI